MRMEILELIWIVEDEGLEPSLNDEVVLSKFRVITRLMTRYSTDESIQLM